MHGLFEEKVKLDLETHVYTHDNGDIYTGFSSVYERISKPFFRGISKKVAEKEGVNAHEVTQRWDAQRDEGVRIDDALTEYCKSGKCEDEKLIPALNQILDNYSAYKENHEQLIVYSEEYKTATAIDKLCLYSNRKDGLYAISDFKCYEKMDLFGGSGWLKEPFSHLPDNKFIKIAFQLSYGAYHFEQLTGRKAKKLFIHLVQPSTIYSEKINQKIIDVPYLRSDVKLLLDMHKENDLNKLNPELTF